MDINEIINSIPYLTKGQLYQLHSEAAAAIELIEEEERKHRERVHQRQVEIVDEMNKLLREFHGLSVSLSAPDSDDYMDSYSDCFVDGDYAYPVFGFSIDCDNDIWVSINPDDDVAAWYREEKEELVKRKNEKKG